MTARQRDEAGTNRLDRAQIRHEGPLGRVYKIKFPSYQRKMKNGRVMAKNGPGQTPQIGTNHMVRDKPSELSSNFA